VLTILGAPSLRIGGGVITSVGDAVVERGDEVIDGRGLIVAPGFVDLQCNGAYDIDLTAEPERMWDLAARLPSQGVTSFLPTLVSCPSRTIERALAAWRNRPAGFRGAEPLGLHLEGPMLSPARAGAHRTSELMPAVVAGCDGWEPHRGVAMVTVAPELPGGLDVIGALSGRGVVVAAGHTDATTSEMLAGVDAGVTAVTHLFNAMAPLAHRQPGPVGVALADPRLTATLIVDGVHVDPLVVAAVWPALRPGRLALVTDSVGGGGLAGRPVTVDGGAARTDDGRLAGSTLTMGRAVANLVAFTGCPLDAAIACATATPARLLGLADRGRLVPGCRADVALLTPSLDVVTVIVGGSVVYP
jgi:N-acetylglucosamine-6-phosphate deacetylase